MPAAIIDLSKLELFEAGSMILSYLMYPRIPADNTQRSLHIDALCHAVLRYRAKHDPVWASFKQELRPRQAFIDERQFDKGVKQSRRRHRDRRVAGQMAIGFLREPLFGEAPRLPEGMRRPSVTALAEYFLEMSGETDPVNVVKRAWSETKPVMHLAAAFAVYERAADARGETGNFAAVQHIAAALDEVLALTAEFELAVPKAARIGIKREQLIHFEVIRPGQK